MTPPDPAREAAILARCEAATKGPWVECKPMCLAPVVRDSRGLYVCETRTTEPGGLVQPTHAETVSSHADAAFIAHAREDVPYLLAQLTAARARAERAEGALVEIRAEMPATCTCDAAYSGRHLADPSCGYHDYGALCLEIIDHALAARGE